MSVVVTGIGCQTALGDLDETWRRLLLGQSGIKNHQPFPSFPVSPLAMMRLQAMTLSDLVIPIVKAACIDAQLTLPLKDCVVIVGSSRGNQARLEQVLSHSVTIDWLDLLPNYAAIAAARYIGTTAEVHSPMAACATGLMTIAQGFQLLQENLCDRVIVGAIDAPITPLTLAGFERMGALAKTGCYPFDKRREGFVLGEGGAVLVLERSAQAEARGAKIYGEILGTSATADAFHFSAPEPTGNMASIAIQRCLIQSQRHASDVDYIHAHGTATRLNDAREAQLIQTIFPTAAVSSSKGAIGHTLGASGAIGIALCLKALQTQTLPPSVGLREPDYPQIDWIRSARHQKIETAVCLSFGFGGQNAAIAVGRV